MEKRLSSFIYPPHFEDSRQGTTAKLLNRILAVVAVAALFGGLATLLTGNWGSTIVLGGLLFLLLIVKIILQQGKLPFAACLLLASLSLCNLLLSALLPGLSMPGISLALISVAALLLCGFGLALFFYAINLLGMLLLTLASWRADIQLLYSLAWIALTVFLILMILKHFLQIDRERDTDLQLVCERFEQESTRLQLDLEQARSQLAAETETRKGLEMQVQDESQLDPSHRFNSQSGIYTEKAIFEMIEQEISRTRRYQRPLSLLCIRVDHMMDVVEKANLTPGKLLSMLSDTFNESLRREDVLGHFNSDGFYTLLPETGRYASYVVAERLRHLVEVMSLFNADEGVPFTISIGLAACQDQGKMNAEVFTNQAIEALEAAEEHGGNWTISWHDLSHNP